MFTKNWNPFDVTNVQQHLVLRTGCKDIQEWCISKSVHSCVHIVPSGLKLKHISTIIPWHIILKNTEGATPKPILLLRFDYELKNSFPQSHHIYKVPSLELATPIRRRRHVIIIYPSIHGQGGIGTLGNTLNFSRGQIQPFFSYKLFPLIFEFFQTVCVIGIRRC